MLDSLLEVLQHYHSLLVASPHESVAQVAPAKIVEICAGLTDEGVS